ncbi:type IIG restriction enzyme/methyltransferase [Helicobacter muridarum]
MSLESKAFYESILYFLREFITHKNNNITYIILTNTQKFYCIDAQEYMQFAKHKEIVKAFKNCEKKDGNDTSTKRFYEMLKFLLPNINSTLKYTYFCLDESLLDSNLIYHAASSSHFESFSCHSEALAKDFQTIESKINKYQTSLALIYQAISPSTLLKHKVCIDSNTLNQSFYNELLYILGLEEKVQNSKVIIEPSHTPNTLLDSTCFEFKLSRDKDFETLFALLTTWNNRLLFLRLLESMLLGFKHILKPFLDLETLKDFPAISTLFFDVLAKVEESRGKNLTESLQAIPYLNSSLFEETPLENEGKQIGSLKSKPLTLYADSILYKDEQIRKDLNIKGKDSALPLLEYLFAFLHAYDFTTTSNDIQNHIKINYDKLINAAVLGLVFEKLNGYKEGSFYTPSFITSYMCKQSLEKVVLEKFNSVKNWQCADLESLKTKLDKLTNSKEDYKQANAIFDSIKICDPSVGSGHFLVSALNELILLKFQLGILCDENYSRIKDISLEILHDEIVIRDSNNALFTYTLPAHENIESHKIQRALFHNKRILIESCLFGVDINQNSCEITKLRLWIELLKYSFYKDIANKRLETLPNIDINIKCGNSLVSYMPISEPLYIDIKEKIKDYQKLESDYFHCFYTDKQQHQKRIYNTKQELLSKFFMRKYYKELKALRKKCDEYSKNYEKYGIDKLSEHYEFLKNNVTTFSFFPQINEIKEEEKAQKALENLKKEHNKIFSLERNFEWRIEFSKLLDNGLTQEQIASNNANKRKGNSRNLHKNKQGDFLGFDLVIGNPPYIRQEEIKHLKPHLQKAFSIYKGTSDIYTYFYELGLKILKDNGILSFITSNKWCRAAYGEPLREFLLKNTQINTYLDFNGVKVFESATVDTSILEFHKAKANASHSLNYANPKDYNPKENKPLEESLELIQIPQDSLSTDSFIFTSPEIAALKAKIEKIGTPLKDWDINIYRGILTGYNEAFIIDTKKREEILSVCDDSEESLKPMSLEEYLRLGGKI